MTYQTIFQAEEARDQMAKSRPDIFVMILDNGDGTFDLVNGGKKPAKDPIVEAAIQRDAIFDEILDLADQAETEEARRIIRHAARQWRADYSPTI